MELPLFPLHLVLFPGRPLPLHLFELRYRQMLRDCLDDSSRFGVVAIKAGLDVGAPPEVHDVGTVAVIEAVTELDDGRFEILTRGTERFRLKGLLGGTPYLKADVEILAEEEPCDFDARLGKAVRDLLIPYLAGLGAPQELLERLPHEPRELAYLAAAAVQADVGEQQRLLELDGIGTRLMATLEMLRRESGLMRHFGTVCSLRPPGPRGADLN